MENKKTVEYKGTFRLVNKVAEGGMATVYEAEQLGPEGFTKRIALKVIHPHYAKRSEFLTVAEVAQRWQLHPESVRRMIRQGRVPRIIVGRQNRVALNTVEAFEKSGGVPDRRLR